MAKYRKKPVVIEALQYFEDGNEFEYLRFCHKLVYDRENKHYYIETLEGNMKISNGDYIIKGVQSEFYPCKPDIFEKTYEMVN